MSAVSKSPKNYHGARALINQIGGGERAGEAAGGPAEGEVGKWNDYRARHARLTGMKMGHGLARENR